MFLACAGIAGLNNGAVKAMEGGGGVDAVHQQIVDLSLNSSPLPDQQIPPSTSLSSSSVQLGDHSDSIEYSDWAPAISNSHKSDDDDREQHPFSVEFVGDLERENFVTCSQYKFCEFMRNALDHMKDPQTISMVRRYGFGLGHVPLLLVWSSHLYDRLTLSKYYSLETRDLEDILVLMLIVDIRAQADAECIRVMKKHRQSAGALAVKTDGKIEEQSKSAPEAAAYLKRKLADLWMPKIAEMHRKKKLPRYSSILARVRELVPLWKDQIIQTPVWVCCVQHAAWMGLSNWWVKWPSDRLGNWWNPEPELIGACSAYEDSHGYHDIRSSKTREVFEQLEKKQLWADYFGAEFYPLKRAQDVEYDSDGGF
jgi:hypothetical protein